MQTPYANGDSYEGIFEKGFQSGQGAMHYANGNCYEGAWKEDKCHGYGVLSINKTIIKKGYLLQDDYLGTDSEEWNEKDSPTYATLKKRLSPKK